MQLSDTFLKHFQALVDPRIDNHNKHHNLHDIFVITILAMICGADNWVDINEFGEAKYDWLSTFLELPNGVPSHDTFGRVFSLIPINLSPAFVNGLSLYPLIFHQKLSL
jgi:hypothetical protein